MTTPAEQLQAEPWISYLDRFHTSRPGITEDVLKATAAGAAETPYSWLIAALPGGRALDLACGSGPLMAEAASRLQWIGIDRSRAELGRATRRGGLVVVRGDATGLPFPDDSFDVVACSMALMLFDPVDTVLGEVRRVLVPGGTAAFLVPGSYPLSWRDRWRYVRLLQALRQMRPAYPTTVHLHGLRRAIAHAGFEICSDERRPFEYQVENEDAARRFVESLYVPGRSPERVAAAMRAATRWVGSDIAVPLRRVVCRTRPGSFTPPKAP